MPEVDDELRQKFLIEWYKILWNSARQSMDGIWKLIGPVTLVGTIWFAMYNQYIPFRLGSSLIFIILFWAINITIDFNQWHRRNLIFYTAIENKFLQKQDYGRLLPRDFRRPKKKWISFYRICFFVFFLMLIFSFLFALVQFDGSMAKRVPWIARYDLLIFFLGFGSTILNYLKNERSAKQYIEELFEDKPTRFVTE